jgi:hypothetical protein
VADGNAVNLNSIYITSMKKALLFACSVVLFAACTEVPFDVTPRVEGGDTTYLATPETAQPRTVVLEEFTGVTCPNCPRGHASVAAMQTQYSGRLLAVSYYANGPAQAAPVDGHTKEDFRTDDATNALSAVFIGIGGLPAASVDRTPVAGQLTYFENQWAGAVAARMAVPSPANVKVTSEWQAGDRTAIIRVRVAYTTAVTKKQALTLILTENDLVDAQESVDTSSTPTGEPLIFTDYVFKHVLRDIITPVTGEAMMNEIETKERGRVYERTFVYKVPKDHWKAEKCTLIAIVHNAESGDKEIVQAAEGKLVE